MGFASIGRDKLDHHGGELATAVCVDPARVPEIWPHVGRLIEAAVVRGAISQFAEIERDILEGRMLLWVAWDGTKIVAAAVTQLSAAPDGRKTGTIVACGADGRALGKFIHLHARLEQFFREEGCARVSILGRPGWKWFLPDYRIKAVIMEKAL